MMKNAVIVYLVLLSSPALSDWPQFRGPNSSGVVAERVPTEFGPGQNELWSVELKSGHSSPCVVGDRIFLTTYDADSKSLGVICLARADGTQLWLREVQVPKVEKGHPSFNPASSTPASDGERVVAYFGSYGLLCFDLNGEQLWAKQMPLTKSYAGNAVSPIIAGDRVILYRGNHVDHFMLALDKNTGEELWQVDQDEPFQSELACTAVPIVKDDMLIAHTARSVQAFELANGKRIWVVKCATTATSTPVLWGDEVVVAAWNKMGEPALRPAFPGFDNLVNDHDKDGDQLISKNELPRLMIFHRPDGAEAPENGGSIRFGSADSNKDGEIDEAEWKRRLNALEAFRSGYKTHGILAIPTDSEGVIEQSSVRTLATQGIPEVPSPLVHDGIVYFLKNGGVLTCLELASGKKYAKIRTKGKGTHYASPIVAGDRMYCTAGNGKISVLSLGRRPKVLAVNDMQDATYATPAAVGGVLYVRTHGKLFAFSE